MARDRKFMVDDWLRQHGFALISTGGGCQAWYARSEENPELYLLVTKDGCDVPQRWSDPVQVNVGVHSDTGSWPSVSFHFASFTVFEHNFNENTERLRPGTSDAFSGVGTDVAAALKARLRAAPIQNAAELVEPILLFPARSPEGGGPAVGYATRLIQSNVVTALTSSDYELAMNAALQARGLYDHRRQGMGASPAVVYPEWLR